MKQTVKSCSCTQCRYSKGRKPVKELMKHEERAARHANKVAINRGIEDIFAAHRGGRYG
jgi:type II secretory ATPase GspE/PulE/Tfp pilus assembly ATPase PilB-like protein